MRRAAVALAAWAMCGVMAACGPVGPVTGTSTETAASGPWREIPGSPLGPRQGALGLWTGREVLLIGGSDEYPCPPSADCLMDRTPLADGAAVDPRAGIWRRLADSPVPFAWGAGVVIGQTAYILPSLPRSARGDELLAYQIEQDRWYRLRAPFEVSAGYGLLAAGDRLVTYLRTDEGRPGGDFLFDPATEAWSQLPADPLGLSFDRAMAWTGNEIVLFDHELTPNPGSEKPAVTRAAALSLTTWSWRRLPDSEILTTAPWIMADGRLINPTLGGADGGRVGNWGRVHPNGGSLDPATARWSPLPKQPAGQEQSAGARTDSTAVYIDLTGLVLDATTGAWIPVPTVPGDELYGRTLVAAGTDMFIFGGGRRRDSASTGTLINRCWLWSPGA